VISAGSATNHTREQHTAEKAHCITSSHYIAISIYPMLAAMTAEVARLANPV
jgi:hypothetical protein